MPYLEIAIIFILILLNGIFAMSELAIVSAKKVHLRKLANEGNKAAAQALAFAEDTSKFLPSVQVGITLIGVLAGAFGGAALSDDLALWLSAQGLSHESANFISVGFIVMLVTYATLILGELVPKELALRRPEKFAIFAAPIVDFVSRVAWPAVWILNKSSRLVLWFIRAGEKPASTVTQEEVEALIREGADYGIFAKKEKEMLSGVMFLADKPVRAFMVPRIDVASLDCDASEADVKAILATHGYSRFPVRVHNDEQHVLGIVETKDILKTLLEGSFRGLEPLIKKVTVFHENTDAIRVMEYLRHAPTHVAIVVDEYGAFEGIVTLVDLFGAITGEFYEHGKEEDIVRRADGSSWLINGSALVEYAFKGIGLHARQEDDSFHTLAGFVLHQFHKVPKAGDFFEYKGYRFEVVDMDGNRIDKVLVSMMPPE